MRVARLRNVSLHWTEEGDTAGPAVVFANSIGTDLRVWDAVVPLLRRGARLVRFDTRGHGLSGSPAGPYTMDDLAADAEALMERIGVRDCVFVGLSLGGMVGMALAARRPDLVSGLVVANSAARLGDSAFWHDRIARIDRGGMEAISGSVIERWFSGAFLDRDEVEAWRAMLIRTPQKGYVGCCHALAGADLTALAERLAVPVLCIAGSEDGASPPDLVRATADLFPDARFVSIDGVGHLPPVEAPAAFAHHLNSFLEELSRV